MCPRTVGRKPSDFGDFYADFTVGKLRPQRTPCFQAGFSGHMPAALVLNYGEPALQDFIRMGVLQTLGVAPDLLCRSFHAGSDGGCEAVFQGQELGGGEMHSLIRSNGGQADGQGFFPLAAVCDAMAQ